MKMIFLGGGASGLVSIIRSRSDTKRRLQDVVRFLYVTKRIGNMYVAPTEVDFSMILAFSVPRLLLFVLRLTMLIGFTLIRMQKKG